MADHYSLLGLGRNATREEIDNKFRSELRLWQRRTSAADLGRRQEAEQRVAQLMEARDDLLGPPEQGSTSNSAGTGASSSGTSGSGGSPQPTPRESRRPRRRTAPTRDAPRPSSRTRRRGGESPQPSPRPAPSSTNADPDNLLQQARDYLTAGQYGRASEAAKHAHSVLGPTAEVWILEARANVGLGRQQDADYEIRQAIDVAGSDAAYLVEIGDLYREIGQPNEAQSIYQRAVNDADQAVRQQATRGIAEIHLNAGRFNDATQAFERLAQETNSVEDRNRLAGILVARAEEAPRIQRGSRYVVTSEHEIRRMRELLRRARGLTENGKLVGHIERIELYLTSCEQPSRSSRTLASYTAIMAGWLVPAILLAFITAQASLTMGIILLAVGLGAGTLHVINDFNTASRPQWSINDRQSGSASPSGSTPLLEGPPRWMPRRQVTTSPSPRQRSWPQPASRSGY